MADREHTETLDLQALRKLCIEGCDLYDKWVTGEGLIAREAARSMDITDEIIHQVPALIAEVDRLRKALAGHLFDGESLSAREAIRSELITIGFEHAAEVDRLHQQITALANELELLAAPLADAKHSFEFGMSEGYHEAARRLRSLLPEADQPEDK